MEKDSKAKFGRTKCDFCDQPSSRAIGNYVVCEAHANRIPAAGTAKAASDASDVPLKAAPIAMSKNHQLGG